MTQNRFHSLKALGIAMLLLAFSPVRAGAHGEVAGGGAQNFRQILQGEHGKYRFEVMHSPALPIVGETTNFELKIVRLLPEPDPLLGSEIPVGLEPEGSLIDADSRKTVDPHLPLHSEGEAGVYGGEYRFPTSGSLLLRFVIETETGDHLTVEFPVTVGRNVAALFRLGVNLSVVALILGLTVLQLWKVRSNGGRLPQMLRPISIGVASLVVVFLAMNFFILDRVLALRAPKIANDAPETVTLNEDGSYTIAETVQKELGITLAEAKQMPLEQFLTAYGNVEPRASHMAEVQAPIWGRIEFAEKPLAVGDRVQRGQRLVWIILELSQLERAPMESKQKDITGALQQAKERLDALQVEYERAQKLFAANPAFEQDLAWAKQLYEEAKSAYEQVRKEDENYVNVIKFRDPRKTLVVSPMSGIITTIDFTPGELNLTGGTPRLFTIVDPSQVWVRGEVFIPDAVRLKHGQPVMVYHPNQPDRPLHGTIRYMDDTVDPVNRTVTILVDVPNPDQKLAFGTFVRLGFARHERGIAVPVGAVVDEGVKQWVYVAREPGQFVPMEVKMGLKNDGWWQVLSGLQEGDLVITKGAGLLGSLRQSQSGEGGQPEI